MFARVRACVRKHGKIFLPHSPPQLVDLATAGTVKPLGKQLFNSAFLLR
jgi:hypothetical protein